MIDAAFDTLSYARRMEQAGFTRTQAEALADEQGRLIDERLATKDDIALVKGDIEGLRLATKGDIASVKGDIEGLRQETKIEFERVRQEMKSLIEMLRRDMVIKLGAMIIAGMAVASALASLLTRLPLRP